MHSLAFSGVKTSFTLPIVYWALLALTTSLVGCQGLATSEMPQPSTLSIPTTAIRDLKPPSDLTKPDSSAAIALKGTVGDRAPLLEASIYQLQDSTGTVWVLTNGRSPEKGQEITIQGLVRYKSIPLNGKEQGSVYIEQK